jgi:hypothetical protein
MFNLNVTQCFYDPEFCNKIFERLYFFHGPKKMPEPGVNRKPAPFIWASIALLCRSCSAADFDELTAEATPPASPPRPPSQARSQAWANPSFARVAPSFAQVALPYCWNNCVNKSSKRQFNCLPAAQIHQRSKHINRGHRSARQQPWSASSSFQFAAVVFNTVWLTIAAALRQPVRCFFGVYVWLHYWTPVHVLLYYWIDVLRKNFAALRAETNLAHFHLSSKAIVHSWSHVHVTGYQMILH